MSEFTDVPSWVPTEFVDQIRPVLESEQWDKAAELLFQAFLNTSDMERSLEEYARHRTSHDAEKVARNFMMSNMRGTAHYYAYGDKFKQLLIEEVIQPVFTNQAYRYGRKGNKTMVHDSFVTSEDAQSENENKSTEIAEDFNEEYPDDLEEDTSESDSEYETHAEDPDYADEDFRGAAMVATSEDASKATSKVYFAEEDEIPAGYDVFNYDGEHYVVLAETPSDTKEIVREAAPRSVVNNLDPVAWLESNRGSEARAIQVAEWLWENMSQDRMYEYMDDERHSPLDSAKPAVEANFMDIHREDREAAIREFVDYLEYNEPDTRSNSRYGRSKNRNRQTSGFTIQEASHLETLGQDIRSEFGRTMQFDGKVNELIRLRDRIEGGNLTPTEIEKELRDFRDTARELYRSLQEEGADRGVVKILDRMISSVEARLDTGSFNRSYEKANAEVGLSWGEIVEIVDVNEEVGTVTMMDQRTESTWQESIAEVESKIETLIDNDHSYIYEIVARQYPDMQPDEVEDLLHSTDDVVSGEQEEQEEQTEDVEALEQMAKFASLCKRAEVPRSIRGTRIESDVRDAIQSGMYDHASDIITDWMLYDTNKFDRLMDEASMAVTGTTVEVSPETIITPLLYDELDIERGNPLWDEMIRTLAPTVREEMKNTARRIREEEEARGGYNRASKSAGPVDIVTEEDVSKVDGYEQAYDAVVTNISFDPDIYTEEELARGGFPSERDIRARARERFNYEYVDDIERYAEQYLETPGEVDRLVAEFETMFIEDAVNRVQQREHRHSDHTRRGYTGGKNSPVAIATEQDVQKYNNPGSGPGSVELTFNNLLDTVGRDVVREYALNYNTQVAARKIMEEFSDIIPEEHRDGVRDMVERQLRAEEERERDPRPQNDSAVPPRRRR